MTHPILPILDLEQFINGDEHSKAQFVDTLRIATHDVGFFYLKGFGLDDEATRQLFDSVRSFFALPAAEKQALHMVNSPHFRGYTSEGSEITRGEKDWREQIDIGAERSILPSDEIPWKRLQGPNQWPASLPALREHVQHLQTTLTTAGLALLRALALVLGQSEQHFTEAFSDTPVQHVKLIRYPGRSTNEPNQGVGAHKDSGCLTFVLQSDKAGLQVYHQEKWIDVAPIPGTVVINLGEVLELLTDGYLRATLHRVVSPAEQEDRLSIAFFLSPRLDTALPPLTLPPELAAKARGVEQDPQNVLVPHTGQNLLKGRLRSHPDVAQRHYADVLSQQVN